MDADRRRSYPAILRAHVSNPFDIETRANPAGCECKLPTKRRMVFWPAAEDIAAYISGYSLYAVEGGREEPNRGAFEPAWASLRIALAGGEDWRLRPLNGEWFAPPRVSLFGPSSALVWSESGAGILIGAGIRPRGWLRLFARPAREWSDRIGPAPMLGGLRPDALHARFCALADDEAVPREFDALFREAMGPLPIHDATIGKIEAALVDPAIRTVAGLTAASGLSVRALERLADRAFGFPPKLLLRRARFLRSLHAIRNAPPGEGAAAIDEGYTDYSHFTRDAHDFLGASLRTFLRVEMPLLSESLKRRAEVLGSPAQALDAAP